MKLLARCGQGSGLPTKDQGFPLWVGAKLSRNGTADVSSAGPQRAELKLRGPDSTLGSGSCYLGRRMRSVSAVTRPEQHDEIEATLGWFFREVALFSLVEPADPYNRADGKFSYTLWDGPFLPAVGR
jgi:hypothetical protein